MNTDEPEKGDRLSFVRGSVLNQLTSLRYGKLEGPSTFVKGPSVEVNVELTGIQDVARERLELSASGL